MYSAKYVFRLSLKYSLKYIYIFYVTLERTSGSDEIELHPLNGSIQIIDDVGGMYANL